MSKANVKHTPGPWVRGGKRCLTIAQKAAGGNLGDVVCLVNGDEDAARDQANARLIAAAPELLEALKMFTDLDSVAMRQLRSTDWGIVCVDMARAAIAKATGEAL